MRRIVNVDSRPVTVAPDDPVDDYDRWQALVIGRAVDELSGRPVDVNCSSPTIRSEARGGAGGVFGIAGRPRNVLAGSRWTMILSADGFAPKTLEGPFAAGMVSLGDIELQRAPVSLFGSASVRPENKPLNNVIVSLDGIKRRESDAESAPDIVALDVPLAAQRPTPTTVKTVTLADQPLAAGELPLQLAKAVESGSSTIDLVDVAAVADGQTLRLGDLDMEFVTVASVEKDKRRANLETSVMVRRSISSPVAKQTVIDGAATALLMDGEIGDVVLFVAQAAIPTRRAVRIQTAGAPDEIRVAIPYQTTTLADGLWKFPPISRVAEVVLKVTRPSHTLFPPVATDPSVRIDYGNHTQRCNFVLKKTP